MGLLLQGAHRGGMRFVERVSGTMLERRGNRLVVADPVSGRANFVAGTARERFPWLDTLPVEVSGRSALPFVGAEDPLVLASDSIDSLRDTLISRSTSQPAFWQIVGRGPGGGAGSRIGLQGTLLTGDRVADADSTLLLEALEQLAPPASSRYLTSTDALSATVLAPMRERVLDRTLRHLHEQTHDPADLTGGPLGIVLGREVLPLKPLPSESTLRYRQQQELAVEALDRVPENHLRDRGALGKHLAVALVESENPKVHFFTVSQSRSGRRRVEGVVTFEQPPAIQVQPAVFTD